MIKKAIPHIFTLSNLVCGVLGIIMAFQTNLIWSSYLIGIAAIFDFFDGFAARMLNVPSKLGAQLDSLADAVTFGVLPGIILFQLISISFGEYYIPFTDRPLDHALWASTAFLIPVFSILRLAIFNLDTQQEDTFLGVPTPANAILIGSFPVILELQYFLNLYFPLTENTVRGMVQVYFWRPFDYYTVLWLQQTEVLVSLGIIMALLLVIRIPMLSFKFKSFGWKANQARYIFLILVLAGILLVFLPYWVRLRFLPYLDYVIIPIILILYIIYSVIIAVLKRLSVGTQPDSRAH